MAVRFPPSQLQASTIAVLVLAWTFTILRFSARHLRRVGLGVDDYLLIASLAVLCALSAIAFAMIHYGLGRDATPDLSAHQALMVKQLLYIFEIFYVINLLLIKLSILFMYRRIFTDMSRFFRVGARICGGVVVLWAIAFIPAATFQCTPVSKAWDSDKEGHCINLRVGFFCVALPNILTDIAILTLPVQVCWQLAGSMLYRLSISGIFLLGAFVIGVSIYRFKLLFLYSSDNVSGTIAPATIWSVIECAVAIICACLPTLMPLVRLVWSRCHRMRQSRRESSSQHLVHSPASDPLEHRQGGAAALNRKNAVDSGGSLVGRPDNGNMAGSGAGRRGMVSVEQVFV
ncbi:hypothetical protein ASPVEDRAFT_41512 [Aspergillus versicolor CBS 583.65]|uniref:Rhodopsin domain-containing protein n=1 Tax=Aspergillus versicolor CBS 583.65 TaxID=1036611 RepID=A0A1L9PKH7_ASPVE|nr:uncharacterized protein ASPVEDRAFT_41512 [Aspergillus versicolor CBS 583.65]OJJ01983.1 hypothetical protein ASPVEDRAFT_41512 [Aspergillus versicolor CBS 583.65]